MQITAGDDQAGLGIHGAYHLAREVGCMDEEFLLLNPGPVPVNESVRAAMDEPMVSHRSTDFEAVYEHARNGLDVKR